MAGLFEKDIRFIFRNKQLVVVVVFMAFILGFSGSIDMILPYMAVFGTIFSVSTISYDEADNGYTYIMTLPITYKEYVCEKYIFCGAGGLSAGLLTMVIFLIGSVAKGELINVNDLLIAVAVVIPLIIIMESVLIPLQLKFGDSKARVFLVMLIGIVIGSVYVAKLCVGDLGQFIEPVLDSLETIPPVVSVIGFVLVTVVILIVSLFCSIRIMKKKQY